MISVVVMMVMMLVLMFVLMLMLVLMFMFMFMLVFMLILVLALYAFQRGGKSIATLESRQNLFAAQLLPRGGDDHCAGILPAQKLHAFSDLVRAHAAGTAENDAPGGFYLIVEEFAEIAHIHFGLGRVHNGAQRVDDQIGALHLFHGGHDIRKLSHARGLDQDAVGGETVHHLAHGGAEIAGQGAADAAGVHFGHLDAGLLHEAAVDADLAEFVLDQNQLLALIGFLDQFFDKSRLSGSEKAGKHIDFCHDTVPSVLLDSKNILYHASQEPIAAAMIAFFTPVVL